MPVPSNTVVYSGFGDMLVTETAASTYLLLLADRNALPAHPALLYVGNVAGSGSNVKKLSHVGLMGYDLMGAETEADDVTNTGLSDGSTSITVADRVKRYEASDLTRMVDGQGVLRGDVLAMDALITASADMAYLVANLVDGFTANTAVGSSGVNASFANFLDAITTLEVAKVQGPYLAMLHPQQWGDIRNDVAANSGGAIQFNAGSQALIDAMKGLGLKGEFAGVTVFTSAHIPTANAGADRAGGMWGRGGVVWADGTPVADDPSNQTLIPGANVLFERIRANSGTRTAFQSKHPVGVSIGIDACGVSIITDA